jgi:hypothetical protein
MVRSDTAVGTPDYISPEVGLVYPISLLNLQINFIAGYSIIFNYLYCTVQLKIVKICRF